MLLRGIDAKAFAASCARHLASLKMVPVACIAGLVILMAPRAAQACGGDGERACCVGCGEGSSACSGGGIEIVTGTARNCGVGTIVLGVDACDPGFHITTNSICEVPKACGGQNQRACCVNERIPSCNSGFVEGPGCGSGDPNCLCAGGDSLFALAPLLLVGSPGRGR